MAVINTRMVSDDSNIPYAIIQNMLVVPFRVEDAQKLQNALLPKPLEPVGKGDTAWVCFVDTVLPALRDGGDGEPPDPDMTEFHEIAIGMPCCYEGKVKGVFPLIYLDRPTAGLHRGILRGIANTQLTQFLPMLKGRDKPAPCVKIVGITNRPTGELMAKAVMELTYAEPWESVPEELKNFLHVRYIVDPASGGKLIAADFTDCVFSQPLAGDVAWRGKCTLEFGGDQYGRFSELGKYETLEGYYLTIGYCYGSDHKVTDMEGRRPAQWI